MERTGASATIRRLLRYGKLRLLLVAAPGLTAAVATITAMESNLVFTAILNALVGIIISSALFIVVSIASQRLADNRLSLVKATQQGVWKVRTEELANVRHENSGLYSDWYFRLRLEEEMERARRYSMDLAVLLVKSRTLHQEAHGAGGWFNDRACQQLRRSDLAALLRDGSVGILLPHLGPKAAVGLQHRLQQELAAVHPRFGLALYPNDGEDVDALIEAGQHALAEEPAPAAAEASAEPALAEPPAEAAMPALAQEPPAAA